MTPRLNVTLQINLAPSDLRHVTQILPHELRQFGEQVSEILLVVDVSPNPMISRVSWDESLRGIYELAERCQERYPHLRLVAADNSPQVAAEVAEMFAGGRPIPDRDWRGAPIYAYFYGLWAARNNYVLHMDSDMMYGGGSQTWVAEAVALLQARPDVLICSPLPGPPTADGCLTAQTLPREPLDSLAYRADQMSTRIFMIDRDRFREKVGAVQVVAPSRRKVWLARLDGYPAYQCAEVILSTALARSGLIRIDFHGRDRGMWSVHPPYRSELFYELLPSLIARIETGDVTMAQRGNYDVDDSMIDWSTAYRPRWQRLLRHAKLGFRNTFIATQSGRRTVASTLS